MNQAAEIANLRATVDWLDRVAAGIDPSHPDAANLQAQATALKAEIYSIRPTVGAE